MRGFGNPGLRKIVIWVVPGLKKNDIRNFWIFNLIFLMRKRLNLSMVDGLEE